MQFCGRLAIVVWLAICAEAWSAEIRWNTNQGQTTVEVIGLGQATLRELQGARWQAERWQQVFAVYAGGSNSLPDIPPMLGNYSIANGCVRFEPPFPVEPGVTYRAVFHPSRLPAMKNDGGREVVSAFCRPASTRASPTVVTRVYPSANVLPENLLKFYLYFSTPMRRGHIYEHIRLLDHAGKPVELPFLEIDEELWNPDMTRLTLFIDPGRIKRGVQPLEELGPVLEEGKSYALEIDRSWQDAEGLPLKENYRKTFKAGPPQRQGIVTDAWKVTAPAMSSVEPLGVLFPEPLDHALAKRLINVVDKKGQAVAGETSLDEDERRWRFVPVKAWTAGRYYITVQTTIEDLAGNNIGKPFEVDVFEGVQPRISDTPVSLSFEVKEPISHQPFPGIRWWEEKRSDPPMHWFVAEIDLKNPKLRLQVAPGGPDPDGPGPWQTILTKPTTIAEREGFDLVINGDFFTHRKLTDPEKTNNPAAALWGSAQGPAVSDGRVWSDSATKKPCLIVHKNGKATIEMAGHPDKDAWQVVAGNTMLLSNAVSVASTATNRHPRTAVGLDRKATRLVILIVDGRKKDEAVGMRYDELAAEFLRLGCWQAMNLDGGGSTVLALRDRTTRTYHLLNAPTDGHERPVADVLGVTVDAGNAKAQRPQRSAN